MQNVSVFLLFGWPEHKCIRAGNWIIIGHNKSYLDFIFVFFSFFNAFVEVFSSLRQNSETQLTLTCSKLTKETLEKFPSYNMIKSVFIMFWKWKNIRASVAYAWNLSKNDTLNTLIYNLKSQQEFLIKILR